MGRSHSGHKQALDMLPLCHSFMIGTLFQRVMSVAMRCSNPFSRQSQSRSKDGCGLLAVHAPHTHGVPPQ